MIRSGLVLLALVAAAAVAAYVWGVPRSTLFWGAVLSAAFGGATGASEITSRYRDEPLRAVVNKYGAGYIGLNAVLAAAAFGLLLRYADQLFPAAKADWLMTSIVAGFGAMVIVRSKLFIFRSEDGREYPIGPAIVIETFLRMLDRKIDRHRASRRQRRVFDAMASVADFDRSADYLTASLLSFQNLSEEEKAGIARVVEQYRAVPWPAALKSAALGMAFLTIAGEENFDQIMVSLKAYLGTFTSSGADAGNRSAPTGPSS